MRQRDRLGIAGALLVLCCICPGLALAQVQGSLCNTLNKVYSPTFLGHNDNTTYICDGSQLWSLWSATASPLSIDFLGTVGIQNSSPGALLDIGTAGTTLGTLRLESSTASSYVQVQPSTTSGSWIMTLPASAGTNGYVLSTDGSGVTTWVAPGSGATITLGTEASATNPQRNGDATTGFYSPAADTVSVAAGGIEAMQWNTAASGNTYVSITPGISAAPTIGVGGTSAGLILNAGSGALTLKSTGSNAAIDITPNGTGPVVVTSGATTGTGATAAMQLVANSLTTGNGLDVSSSSLTSGNLVNLATTSTAAASNTQTVLNISASGANASNNTTYGEQISNTHTNPLTTSGTASIGLSISASGGDQNTGIHNTVTHNTSYGPGGGYDIGTENTVSATTSDPGTLYGVYNTVRADMTDNHVETLYGEYSDLMTHNGTGAGDVGYGLYVQSDSGSTGGTQYGVYANLTAGSGLTAYPGIFMGGNVGIGTTSPQATLDVKGFARLALNSSAPATCTSSNEGAVALTHLAQVCVCDTTPAWNILNTSTACSW